ncbi:hypothetical protein BC835DRAFT_1369196 [Cytidiella melzeri]|nr:hypothetical protein BC835DRAFT_1369196 [Cytidiella melzeri]
MAAAQPPTQQPPPTSQAAPAPAQSAAPTTTGPAAPPSSVESSQTTIQFPNMQTEQVLAILKGLGPNFYTGAAAAARASEPKDSAMAAEALSNMSQTSFGHPPLPTYQHYQPLQSGSPQGLTQGEDGAEGPPGSPSESQDGDEKPKSSSGRRNGRSATMSTEDWTRLRKDNHKEVERRRRGNINEGINELGRIVPNGSGEKAKGAILSRAVQYIHHLKENEARNIEKWTLEKLLMDQAMGDLQAQLDEVKRLWEEERVARQRLEVELAALKAAHGQSSASADAPKNLNHVSPAGEVGGPENRPSPKRAIDEVAGSPSPASDEKGLEERAKRQRLD